MKQVGSKIVVSSCVGQAVVRPQRELIKVLANADVTVISELVGPMYTMDASIGAITGEAIPVTGTAITAKCPPGDNLAMVRALAEIEPGDILVVDAKGFSHWCLGGFQFLEHARRKSGLSGIVVNGAYRDIEEIRAAKFPIYATGISPYSGPKSGPGEVNVAISCGGVVVHPGDILCASGEGIAVVPQRAIKAVADAICQRSAKAQANPAIAEIVSELSEIFDAQLDSDHDVHN